MTDFAMIRAQNLTKYYRSTPALEQLSLEVPAGAVFGILGPNGAGKTTLLRLVMGFVMPSTGTIDRGGILPANIGYLPERAFYPHRFTIHGYLDTVARLAGLRDKSRDKVVMHLLDRVGLSQVASQRLGTCSRGMLQRLGLAQALVDAPEMLVLDEPALGLDPAGQIFMREQILALNRAGKTVMLSSHHLDEVSRVCSHVAVLNHGRLVRTGLLASVLAPRASVTIDTGPISDGVSHLLREQVPNIKVGEHTIMLEGDAASHKAELLRLLLDHGVEIYRLSEARSTLEEVFMEVTEQ